MTSLTCLEQRMLPLLRKDDILEIHDYVNSNKGCHPGVILMATDVILEQRMLPLLRKDDILKIHDCVNSNKGCHPGVILRATDVILEAAYFLTLHPTP